MFKATLMLGSSSFVSLLVGLVATKFWAKWVGPSGMGDLGVMQSLLALAGLFGGLGFGPGLVRFGAEALAGKNDRRMAALRRGTWLLTGFMGGAVLLLIIAFRRPIGDWMLGATVPANAVVWIGVASVFNLAGSVYISLLNAHHRVGALARVNLLNRVAGAALGVALIGWWGEDGIAPSVIAGAMAGWGLSWWLCSREVPGRMKEPSRAETFQAAKDILHFGGPYTASMLVGTGMQYLVPIIVLHMMDKQSVGFYKAAATISTVYLGLLLTAMAQDYYPRLSAASSQPAVLINLINEQHQLMMLLAIPMILTILAAGPILIPFIYTAEFAPVVRILEWQLIGDLLKFSSWTLAFVFLARNQTRLYFLSESASGVMTLICTALAIKGFGLEGLGIAYVVMYAGYYTVVWFLVRTEIPMVWTVFNRRTLVGGLASVALVRMASWGGLERWRTPLACGLAGLAILGSLWIMQRKYGLLNRWRWPERHQPIG